MRKFKMAVVVLLSAILAAMLFAACGPAEEESGGVIDAEVTGVYNAPITVSYSNMRPDANYYLTTVGFQQLTTYGDGTYCLSVTSTVHSAVVITADDLFGSDEGVVFTGVKSNPRTTSIKMYYGTYTSSGSGASLSVQLKKPFRIIVAQGDNNGIGEYYIDTVAWTSNMNDKTSKSLEDYLKANAFIDTTLSVNADTGMFATVNTAVADAAANEAPAVPAMQDAPTSPAYAKIKGAYLGKVPVIKYTELTGADYTIGFGIQMLITYEDGSYGFTVSSAVVKNLKLATAESTWTGTMEASSLTHYFGKYTSTVDDFDEGTLHIALVKPLRIVGHSSALDTSSTFVDTAKWTETDRTADEYLNQNAFKDVSIAVTLANSGFPETALVTA